MKYAVTRPVRHASCSLNFQAVSSIAPPRQIDAILAKPSRDEGV
jgi:hypothetical protein